MTMYAPKRTGYKHDGYTARMQLTCLDHNTYCKRRRKDGTLVSCKWSKRTGRLCAVPVYTKKDYAHIPGKALDTLTPNSVYMNMVYRFDGTYSRHVDRQQLRRSGGVKSKVTKTLAQNIASIPAPSTEELLRSHVSRKNMHQGEI